MLGLFGNTHPANFSEGRFEETLKKYGIERIVFEPCRDVTDGYLRPKRATEYSFLEGNLKTMDSWLKREIYKALHFHDALRHRVHAQRPDPCA